MTPGEKEPSKNDNGVLTNDDLVEAIHSIVKAAVASGRFPSDQAALRAAAGILEPSKTESRDSGYYNSVQSGALPSWMHFLDSKALLPTVALFAIVIIKVLSVVRFEPITALALVQAAGPVSVIVGSIIAVVPLLAPLAFFLAAIAADQYRRHQGVAWRDLGRRASAGIVFVLIFFLAIQLLVTPWLIVLMYVFGGLIFMADGLWREDVQAENNDRHWRQGSSYLKITVLTIYTALTVLLLLGSAMWLPLEQTKVQNRPVLLAYVIDDDGEWSSLLTEEQRSILRVKTSDIDSREICRAKGKPSRFISRLEFVTRRYFGISILSQMERSRTPLCQISK